MKFVRKNRLFAVRAFAVALVLAGAHAVVRAGFGAPPSFSPTPINQRNSEGDAVGVVIGATGNSASPSLSYTVTAVNATGVLGMPAGLTAVNGVDGSGHKVLSISGTLTKSGAGLDNGSVGLYTVTVTVTDAGAPSGSNTAQAVFTWDVSRWTRGDLFVGEGNFQWAVYDKDGTWKQTVTLQDVPPASELLPDPFNPGSNFAPSGWTAGCGVNYQTGEVWATNFDDIYPALNVIKRQAPYIDRAARVSTHRGSTFSPYPVDIDPESVVFNNAQDFFVGHSFGLFNANFDPIDANGNPTQLNGNIVDVNGDPILSVTGDVIDGNAWRGPDGYYITSAGGLNFPILGQDGQPVPVREQAGRTLHQYQYSSSTNNWPTRNIFNTTTVSTGTDQIDLTSDGRIYYTSESNYILAYDPATGTQLPVFGGGPLSTQSLYGIRLLPPGDGTGGMIVAAGNSLLRFDGSGALVKQFDVNDDPDYPDTNGGVDGWYAVDVDPDARTMWAANANDIYHFDIATGAIIPVGPTHARKIRVYSDPQSRQTVASIGGMCVMGEYAAAKEICGDGIDNDGNGLIDENCTSIEICSPDHPGDDNGDGLADVNDPQCGAPAGLCATNPDGSMAPTGLSVGGFCDRLTPEGTVVSAMSTLTLPCSSVATCLAWQPSFSATGLPPGMRIDGLTGVISGAPSYTIVTNTPAAAPVPFTVTVSAEWTNPQTGVITDFSKSMNWGVSNTNQAPTPVDDTANAIAGQSVTIGVLGNDTDPDGDTVSLVSFTQPARGTVTRVGSQLQYTAPAGFSGTVNFTYLVQDSYTPAASATATVIVTVIAGPTAANDTYTALAGLPLTVSASSGVLHNDTDPQLRPLQVQAGSVSTPSHGTVTMNADGSFIYTAVAGFNGTDTFTYLANDGLLSSNAATVAINVSLPPVAVNDVYSMPLSLPVVPLVIGAANGLLKNDTDPPNLGFLRVLTSTVSAASHGLVIVASDGSFTYTPLLNFSGTDSFTYSISDGTYTSNTATVTLTVRTTNRAPVAVNDSYVVIAGLTLNVQTSSGVLVNDSDPDGDVIHAVLVTSPSHGTLVGGLDSRGGFGYQGTPGYYGTDTFTYKVNDGQADSAPATVTIRVDQSPSAQADGYTTPSGTTLTVNAPGLLSNDFDSDSGDVLTVVTSSVTTPAHGTVTAAANGSFVYVPGAGFRGTDTFTYQITDAFANSNVAMVTITVADRAPVAVNDSYTLNSGTTLTVATATGIRSNDSDPDDATATLTTAVVAGPAHGALTLNADGSFSYTPAAGYSGADSFTYQAKDSGGLTSNTATVTFTIVAPPAAVNDAYTTAEDTTLTVASGAGVRVNDINPNGTTAALSVTLVSTVSHGTLTLNADGSFTYGPAANYNGPDAFTYTVRDAGGLTSNVATAAITVTPVNDAPVAVNDSYTMLQGATLTVPAATGVRANDTDIEDASSALAVVLVSNVSQGTLTLSADGSFTYVPVATFTGTVTFTYQVRDTAGALSNIATATIVVNLSNRPPVAANDAYTTLQGVTLTVPSATGVRANDSDPDDATATLTVTRVTNVAHGTLTLNADGSFVYVPTSGFSGADAFTYTVKDPKGAVSNTATATLTVRANHPPVASNNTYSTVRNTVLTLTAPGILANDSDPDGDAITAALVTNVTHGALMLNANGGFTYTPANGFLGTDYFTYRAVDAGGLTSNIATITITVVCSGPVAADDAYNVTKNVTLSVPAPGVIANDSDPSGHTMTATRVTSVAHGTLTLNSNGSFTYVPTTNYTGTDSFTYKVSDGSLFSNIATVTLTIKEPGRPPVAGNDAYTTRKNTMLSIAVPGVLYNDSDPDGGAVTAVLATTTAHGALSLNASGAFTYTPASNFSGTDTFTYRAKDSTGMTSNLATVTITVQAHYGGDGCDHDRHRNGHHDGDGCDHDKTIHCGHYDGDNCDHTRHRAGHYDGDGCDHDEATRSGHYDGDRCDHDLHRNGHHDGDNCAHDKAEHSSHVMGDGCDHDRHRNGHYDGDGCDHDRITRHGDGDNCDHDRHVNGHYDGDGCDHDHRHRWS